MHLVIDADPIVYRAGFSAESHHYHVVAEDEEGQIVEAYFEPKEVGKKWVTAGSQMKTWLTNKTLLDKSMVVKAEPVEHALHLVKQEIGSIIGAAQRKYYLPDKVTIVLSGPDNFREKLATLRPYKGNRDPAHKPYHYQSIRNFLTSQYSARVVSGREADDECSIIGWDAYEREELCVIASIDKDLDQIPGTHYDYRRKVFYDVTVYTGERWFWTQVLQGDVTDNIAGCYKIGEERAENIIQDIINTAHDEIWPTPQEFWARIIEEYSLSQARHGCPYTDKDYREVAIENAQLVYMQRKPLELWQPPGWPEQWLSGGLDD